MNFLRYLYESDESLARTKRIGDNLTRTFAPIGINETHVISVQANAFIECKPQETLDNFEEYTHMQVALLDEKREFVSLKNIYPSFASLAEFETYFDGQVYPCVPVDLIDEVFHELVLKKTIGERYYA
jgi:hypothetical protein